MVTQPKLYTVEEFEQFIALPENRERYFELINGEIVEKAMPTREHGKLTMHIAGPMFIFTQANNLPTPEVEVRYRVPDDDHNSRQPDLSFSLDPTIVKKGAVPGMPDLAVEVKSPDDTYKEMRERAEYYLANGTRIVWLVYPEKRLIEVFRLNGDSEFFTENDLLDGGDVLPGFTLKVSEVFNI
jgi:Uma2 family endonuclease